MAEPTQTLIALLLALLVGESSGKPTPTPTAVPSTAKATVSCELQLTAGQGSQTVTARLRATSDQAFDGTYVLQVAGRGSSAVKIHDEQDVSLAAGQTLVLGALDLDSGTRLSGSLKLMAADGDTICHDAL